MSQTDPIGDLLTRVRNGSRAGKAQVDAPASKIGSALMECLKHEGFIQNWRLMAEGNPQGILRIYLKYTNDETSVITDLKRVSKPGRRVYAKKNRLPRVLGGLGTAILSTSTGVITTRQAAERGVGGEVLAFVW